VSVSGTTATAVGTGKRNTELLIAQNQKYPAALICAAYRAGGFADWFLPGKDELDLMYKNLKTKGLGGFTDSWYWSSSELNGNYARLQNFDNGYQYSNYKDITDFVRAVRAF
jgi:hypothetical protein